jgi:hypothetical protein
MEAIPTDAKDRPQSDIVIEDTIVFVNPYTEVDAQVSCILFERSIFGIESIFS